MLSVAWTVAVVVAIAVAVAVSVTAVVAAAVAVVAAVAVAFHVSVEVAAAAIIVCFCYCCFGAGGGGSGGGHGDQVAVLVLQRRAVVVVVIVIDRSPRISASFMRQKVASNNIKFMPSRRFFGAPAMSRNKGLCESPVCAGSSVRWKTYMWTDDSIRKSRTGRSYWWKI